MIDHEQCLQFLSHPQFDPITKKKLNKERIKIYLMQCQKYGYYLDRYNNIYREKQRCYTGVKDIDIKICTYIDNFILINLLQTNSYMKSISEQVWKEKILLNYPNLPLPLNINYRQLYYKTRGLYSSLFYEALTKGYNELLDWLKLPENVINQNIESLPSFPELTEKLLEAGIIPRKQSINHAAECGYIEIIELLYKFQLYPDVDYLLRNEYKGILYKVLVTGKRPSQDKVDDAKRQKEYKIIYLLSLYNIFPR